MSTQIALKSTGQPAIIPDGQIATMPANYYNKFASSKKYARLLFREGYVLQGRELNEMQEQAAYQTASVASALFKDGDIIRDAQIIINAETGKVIATAGHIFLGGMVHAIEAAEFDIPMDGIVNIGVYLDIEIISPLEDPELYNPAVGARAEGESGAWRLQATPVWGFDGDAQVGEFFPIHTVIDGVANAKEPPPNLDSFNLSIARYDRDSTGGGSYIVSGLVMRSAENNGDNQVYTVTEGRARVHGHGIELPTSRRINYEAIPDLRNIDTEVHTSTGVARQRINVAHTPIHEIIDVKVTLQKTVSIVHGGFLGASDTLPNTSIVNIIECKQGDTRYVVADDYIRTGDAINWSPLGAEPAPGSTFDCTYTYMADGIVEAKDYDGFFVAGAIAGSSIILEYTHALPRLDRLCMTQDGAFFWRKGIASIINPILPNVSDDVLPIAHVRQTWRGESTVQNDGIRVSSFAEIESQNDRIDYLMREVSRNRLEASITAREAGARVGIFVDPFLDDSMRDQGLEQSAAIVGGMLTLSIAAEVMALPQPIAIPMTLDYTPIIILAQTLKTDSMAVNPYMAFAIMPANVVITPAIDRWTETQTEWESAVTERFRVSTGGGGSGWAISLGSTTTTNTEVVSTVSNNIEYLRPLNINFSLSGFGSGERLNSVVFDGINVPFSPSNIVADSNGTASGSFRIPAKVPAGAKTVTFRGAATTGAATFVGQGNLTVTTLRQVRSITSTFYDPLAQTFVLERNTQICGVDLWFTAKASNAEVSVQIREVQNGVPTQIVLAEALVNVQDIVITGNGHTRVNFPILVQLLANTQYAIVILCNDPITALAIAEMGKFDKHVQKWVASQPYTVGVLLSSSNASTWDAHQTKDLTFRLLEANFTNMAKQVEMGSIAVNEATDLIMLALDEMPTADTQVGYELALPDGKTFLQVAQGQPVRLPAPITGAVRVSAKLTGNAQAAPLLWPGAQLLTGKISQSNNYYTRSISATGAIRATVIYDAFVPSGATVVPEIKLDSGAWQAIALDGTVNQGDGLVEYSFSKALSTINLIKLRLTLTGSSGARPFVSNLRMMAIK